jgi:hypothetical protein
MRPLNGSLSMGTLITLYVYFQNFTTKKKMRQQAQSGREHH